MIELTKARVLLAVAAVIAVHAIVVTNRRLSHAGDFDVSREFGRRLLAHEELYAGGLHYPYLPAAALSFAPFALIPAPLGFALRYLTALVSLALTLRWLLRLAQPWSPRLLERRWPVCAATLLLAVPYVVRDLDDGGPHLILLALAVGGLQSAARGRTVLAGVCIGVATAIKTPYGLLILFFALNRQMRLAAWSSAALALCVAAPLPLMGPASWYRHHLQWAEHASASVRLSPIAGIAALSEARVQNQALAPVVRRWVTRRAPSVSPPPGGGDTERAARTTATAAALALLLAVAWLSRGARPRNARWLPHASIVLIASALLAPVSWVQHLVVLVPALFLVALRRLDISRPATLFDAGLIAYVVLALVLNRELLGRDSYLVLLTCGIHTAAALIAAGLVVASNPPRAAGAP